MAYNCGTTTRYSLFKFLEIIVAVDPTTLFIAVYNRFILPHLFYCVLHLTVCLLNLGEINCIEICNDVLL